jgi:hypothetical protein
MTPSGHVAFRISIVILMLVPWCYARLTLGCLGPEKGEPKLVPMCVSKCLPKCLPKWMPMCPYVFVWVCVIVSTLHFPPCWVTLEFTCVFVWNLNCDLKKCNNFKLYISKKTLDLIMRAKFEIFWKNTCTNRVANGNQGQVILWWMSGKLVSIGQYELGSNLALSLGIHLVIGRAELGHVGIGCKVWRQKKSLHKNFRKTYSKDEEFSNVTKQNDSHTRNVNSK